MKAVITVPWGQRLGGAEMMLWAFLRHVDRSRLDLTVAFLEPGAFEQEVTSLGHHTVVIPSGRLRQTSRAVQAVRRLAHLIREAQPDVLLNWSPKTHLYGASAVALARTPCRVAWWQHGVPSGHWMDRLATRLPVYAVGCSSVAAARQQRRLWPRRRTFVVYPGIDPPEPSTVTDRNMVRRRLAIPEGRFVVGIVGRLQPWKGQHHLIRTVAELRRRGHDVHGLVVGGDAYQLSPEYEVSLRALVRELGLESAVTFTGQVPDASAYLDLMDVAVNASDAEPFGIVLLEAMARAVPVVAVDAAGPAEIVRSGRSGVLVARADPHLFARAIEPFLLDPQLRLRIGEGGAARYQKLFTAARMTEQLTQQLTRIAAWR